MTRNRRGARLTMESHQLLVSRNWNEGAPQGDKKKVDTSVSNSEQVDKTNIYIAKFGIGGPSIVNQTNEGSMPTINRQFRFQSSRIGDNRVVGR